MIIHVQMTWRALYAFLWQNYLKNPAHGRHQLSRPMRIVGPIQFWRGCVIYRSATKSGLGPSKNVDSVHAKVGTRSTQNCWLGSLRNTSPFLGLYSWSRLRLRSNSGTHPRFLSSTWDRDQTLEPDTDNEWRYDDISAGISQDLVLNSPKQAKIGQTSTGISQDCLCTSGTHPCF